MSPVNSDGNLGRRCGVWYHGAVESGRGTKNESMNGVRKDCIWLDWTGPDWAGRLMIKAGRWTLEVGRWTLDVGASAGAGVTYSRQGAADALVAPRNPSNDRTKLSKLRITGQPRCVSSDGGGGPSTGRPCKRHPAAREQAAREQADRAQRQTAHTHVY